MKRLVAILLAALLALAVIPALAEGTYTDEGTVKAVQQALNDAGYDCGAPTGFLSAGTRQAIANYENANGMPETGTITDALLEALSVSPAPNANGITFQSIPWGSTPEECEAILKESGLIGPDTSLYFGEGYTIIWPTLETSMRNDLQFGSGPENIGGYVWVDIQKTIAGHKVNTLYLNYLFDIQGDVLTDTPQLTSAYLEFEDDGNHSVFNDLTAKLSAIYGDYSEHKEEYDFCTVRIWHGAKNTGICLIDQGGYYTNLVYAKTDESAKAARASQLYNANAAPVEDAGL